MNKICNNCKINKAVGDYHRSSSTKDGLQYTCKLCQTTNKKQYYISNPDKRWFLKRPDEALQRAYRYKEKNWEKMMWLGAKNNAKKMDREFSIKESDILIPEFCPLLGIKLTRLLGRGRVGTNPSLDRIDNSIGYTPDNIMVVSEKANRIKMNLTIKELRTLANNINKIYAKL